MTLCTYAVAVYIGLLLWALLINVTVIVKMAEFTVGSFVSHFTNWNYWYAGIVYLLLLSFIREHKPGRCVSVHMAGCVMAWAFFPLYTLTWFVFWAVTVMLAEDSEFITNLFAVMDPGLVMIGDAYFHFIPLLVIIIVIVFFRDTIYFGTNRQCVSCFNQCGTTGVVFYALYLIVGGPLLFMISYYIVLAIMGKSPESVYGTELHSLFGLFMLCVIGLATSGSYLLVLDQCHHVRKKSNHPFYDEARAMLKTDDELFGDKRYMVESLLDQHLDVAATKAMMDIVEETLDNRAEFAAQQRQTPQIGKLTSSKKPIQYQW